MCVCVCLGTGGLLYTYAYVQYSTYSLVGGVHSIFCSGLRVQEIFTYCIYILKDEH